MDRRSFLRSLFAASVAAAVPTLPASAHERIAARAAAAVRFHGGFGMSFGVLPRRLTNAELCALTSDEGVSTTVRAIGDGVYECSVTGLGRTVTIDSGDPAGLMIGDEHYVREYLRQHPDRIASTECTFGTNISRLTFWLKDVES